MDQEHPASPDRPVLHALYQFGSGGFASVTARFISR